MDVPDIPSATFQPGTNRPAKSALPAVGYLLKNGTAASFVWIAKNAIMKNSLKGGNA